jgi:ADP-ribose pyrophosphatase
MKIGPVEKLTNKQHLNLFAIHFLDRAQRERLWYVASRRDPPKCVSQTTELPDAVLIVARHRDSGGIVVVKEFRVPLGGYQYGFPAGLIDPGETVEEAAARELREETGLSVVRIIRKSPPLFSSSGMTDESVVMVYVEATGEISTAENSESELIQPFCVSPGEAGELCRQPDHLFDVKTWLVLDAFAASGRLM